MLSRQLLKDAKVEHGDRVEVRFSVCDQNGVDVPCELEVALSENEPTQTARDALTAGERRGFAHRVNSAKTMETRNRQVVEVIDSLMP